MDIKIKRKIYNPRTDIFEEKEVSLDYEISVVSKITQKRYTYSAYNYEFIRDAILINALEFSVKYDLEDVKELTIKRI